MPESNDILEIRQSVRQLCAKYGEDYWLQLDRERGFPTEFVSELTESGFLTVLIPEEYGGDSICVRISALKGDGLDDLLVHALHGEHLRRRRRADIALQQRQ